MASTLQKHTITAFYESRDYADSAATKLRVAGVAASDVTVSPETAQADYGLYGSDATTTAPRKTGFWASLEDMFGGTDDHHTYAEGVRRGHVLLTAHVTDAQLDKSHRHRRGARLHRPRRARGELAQRGLDRCGSRRRRDGGHGGVAGVGAAWAWPWAGHGARHQAWSPPKPSWRNPRVRRPLPSSPDRDAEAGSRHR